MYVLDNVIKNGIKSLNIIFLANSKKFTIVRTYNKMKLQTDKTESYLAMLAV